MSAREGSGWRAPSIRREEMIQVFLEEDAKSFPTLHVSKEGDVGYDLYTSSDTIIPPGINLPATDIPTGIRIKLPKGTWGLIFPRSGTHNNFPTLRICQSPIDNGYTGPLTPRFKNIGTEEVLVKHGTRLAQLVLFSAITPKVKVVSALPKTTRGDKRYGSTGK